MAATKHRPGARARNLLVELGTEELPPRALKSLGQSFAERIFKGLVEAGVAEDEAGNCKAYYTPRRLAVWVRGVAPRQADQREHKRGPSLQAAFDEAGHPTPAALGFARSRGVEVDKLKRHKTDQGEWLVHERRVRGEKLNVILERCLADAVRMLPMPRRMRWGDGEAEFVRPAHWLLVLHGSEVLRTGVLGLKAGGFSRGHRFHCPGALRIPSANRYAATLKTSGFVLADHEARRAVIEKQALALARRAGAQAVIDPDLLDEVTGLVEWPVSIMGEFDARFLKLPVEVLVSTLAHHQKYFYLVNAKKKPAPLFIAVSNIKSKAPRRVRAGNERVLRARLADADFFWRADRKKPLEMRIDDLDGVLFHDRLGSMLDKSRRMETLALGLADATGADRGQVQQAARLCKADLVTDMVGEFPDLQGVMGRYYAKDQGLDKSVAEALESHYLPRHAGDRLPGSDVGRCLALADRMDTLAGIFTCDERSSGDKDPFGLRRAALGVLRILIECELDLDLAELIDAAVKAQPAGDKSPPAQEVARDLYAFFADRLRGYCLSRGYHAESIAAVQACNPTRPLDFFIRLRAVDRFVKGHHGAAVSLASANKRIANILSKNAISEKQATGFARELLAHESEKQLVQALLAIEKDVLAAFEERDYNKGLNRLATLKAPIDGFFDAVMVLDKDAKVRNNRLALLLRIRGLFLHVADLSLVRMES